jgi:uncharacterized protein YndB with AHSA1/START domain
MPSFTVTGHADAPVEEVWKLLFDPTSFPRWWVGVETVRTNTVDGYTVWPTGYPDFPMPQLLRTDPAGGRVTVSCQVSDIDFVWQLAESGPATDIEVRVELPEAEAHRADTQRDLITASVARLAALAAAAG